jgi:hypothetical protein
MRLRLPSWLRRRKPSTSPATPPPPLREFVYLDEVSVMSLLASQLGAVPEEFTDTMSMATRDQLASSINGSVAGILKSEISSTAETTQTQGTQVVRKSSAQAAFKHLSDIADERLLLRSRLDIEPPHISTFAQLSQAVSNGAAGPWVVPVGDLERGRLFEIRTELKADPIVRVSTVLSTFIDLIKKYPEMADAIDVQEFGRIVSGTELLKELLAGLVPVRGKVLDYGVVSVDGSQWLIHRRLLDRISDASPSSIELVAFAELQHFWKDIRRVLFSDSPYIIMGRIGRPGLQQDWNPVKLGEVVQEVSPQLAQTLGAAGEGLLAAIRESQEGGRDRALDSAKTAALLDYRILLCERYGQADSLLNVISYDQRQTTWKNFDEFRFAFRAATGAIAEGLGVVIDTETAADVRAEAIAAAGLSADGLTLLQTAGSGSGVHTASAGPFLDAEIIAIYW